MLSLLALFVGGQATTAEPFVSTAPSRASWEALGEHDATGVERTTHSMTFSAPSGPEPRSALGGRPLITSVPFGARGSARSTRSPGQQAGHTIRNGERGSGAFTRFLPTPPRDAARMTAIAAAAAADLDESDVFDRSPPVTGAMQYILDRGASSTSSMDGRGHQTTAHVVVTVRGAIDMYPKSSSAAHPEDGGTLWSRDRGALEAPLALLTHEVHHTLWWRDAYEEDPKANPFTEPRYTSHQSAAVDASGISRRAIMHKLHDSKSAGPGPGGSYAYSAKGVTLNPKP